jgi:hypothetical protein
MSASLENYTGGTFLSDLITRPEFLQYTAEGIFNQSKWIQSGIVARNAALDARAGGTRVQVPFFDPYCSYGRADYLRIYLGHLDCWLPDSPKDDG